MRFAHPAVLWLLLVIPPAIAAFLWWAARRRRELMARFIETRLLPGLTVGLSPFRQRLRSLLFVTAVALLIIALARPQWGFDWQEAHLRGLDIVVAIDTSRSMLAEDIAPNRLARAKLATLDLVKLARSDRLALVAFAGTAFLQCPMTIDDNAFRQSLESLDTSIISQGGTAIAEAIRVAETAYKEGENHRVLVLITDGEDQDSGAVEAAKKAAESGLRIYTIGVGTPEGELLRVKGSDGQTDYIRDEQGNVVKSRMNEELLRQIAGATEGGFYLPLRGAKTMETLFEQGLAKLPKSDRQEKLIKRYHERFHWPLAAAILLLVLEAVFPERSRRRSPLAGQTLKALAAAAVLCALLPVTASGSAARALRDYKEGNFPEAKNEYDRILRQNPDDTRLQFNAGAAAYRNRQFDEAAKHFGKALSGPDLNLQEMGYYNRGNAQYYLGENTPDATARKDLWKKAVQDFESSLKLNPKDADAQHNRDLVKKRLEELQQQQQQNQQQQKSPDSDDQQQNSQSKQDSKQEQQQQEQQNQQQQDQQAGQQNQSNEKQSAQSQDQQSQQSSGQQQEASNQSDQKETGQEQKPSEANSNDSPKEGEQKAFGNTETNAPARDQTANTPTPAGQMTPEEARQLLDQQKGNEQVLPSKPRKPADLAKPKRDW